jgi:hypothetical protein
MKEILYNLALIETINLCKRQAIDCSGSYLVKVERKYTYKLIKSGTGEVLCGVTFYKNSTPQYFM